MLYRIVLFYVFTWFFIMLLGSLQQITGLLPPEVGLAQWGPGIAALLMLLIFRKDGHTFTFHQKGTTAWRYAAAALLPAGLALVVWAVRRLTGLEPPEQGAVLNALPLMIAWMPLGALGEELGWRGYLNPLLNRRWNGLVSAVLTGALWMPIHVGFLGDGPLMLAALALLIVSYSVVLYALVHDRGFSVLLAGVFHLTINLSNLLFLDVIHNPRFMLINAGVWAAAAAIAVLYRHRAFFQRAPSTVVSGENRHA